MAQNKTSEEYGSGSGSSSSSYEFIDGNNASDGAFSLSALAIASANERDRRQRRNLVDNMVRVLFDAFGKGEGTTNNNEDFPGDGILPNTEELEQQKLNRNELVEAILGQDSGSTPIATNLSSVTAKTKTTWNRSRPPFVHWVWQKLEDDKGCALYSTCNMSFLANNGIAIDLFVPSVTNKTGAEELQAAANDAQQLHNGDEQQAIATCDVSKFQWTLEGTTKKAGDDSSAEDNTPDVFEDIQGFWKIDGAALSLTMPTFGDVITEEILLECKDLSLMGRIVDENKNNDEKTPLKLQSKSVLSLNVSSIGTVGGADVEKRRVGMALRALVDYLDGIASVPNLHLSLKDLASGKSESEEIPSFEQVGESMTLGDAMKYYLKYYCNGEPKKNKLGENIASSIKSKKFLTMGDSMVTFGAMAATGTSMITPLGAAVSVAALAAKDGVAAAARKGKEVRISLQQQKLNAASEAAKKAEAGDEFSNRVSLDLGAAVASPDGSTKATVVEDGETAPPGSENKSGPDGYKFGDVTRNLIGSIREKSSKVVAGASNGQAHPGALRPDGKSDEDGYKFGDVTRGLIGSFREKRQQKQSLDLGEASGNTESNDYLEENKGRFAGVAGGSAGAAAGLVMAGPIGALAGSFIGSVSGQAAVHGQQEDDGGEATNANSSKQYRFGDNLRGVIARGKESVGRDTTDGYRFGDFSRGLMAKVKGGAADREPQQTQQSMLQEQHRNEE